MFEKHLWKSAILSKTQVDDLHLLTCIWGKKSVRFSSKIKRKNQERFSVIYTDLAIIPKFHRTAGANQARFKRRSLQVGR